MPHIVKPHIRHPGFRPHLVPCPLGRANPKKQSFGIRILSIKDDELARQALRHADSPFAHHLRIERPNRDQPIFKIYVLPHEREQFSPPHSGVQGAYEDWAKVSPWPLTRRQQASLFL